eukprot:comp21314_c0_seq2/m.45764 comp21314_c0_seq2/g.45764  ORF comp21314_c0_seq2/g.45764 comp21314_c0_seq2/m.45764 type:complete len:349 (-) comp21314_c0_seq2:151-1197(-)
MKGGNEYGVGKAMRMRVWRGPSPSRMCCTVTAVAAKRAVPDSIFILSSPPLSTAARSASAAEASMASSAVHAPMAWQMTFGSTAFMTRSLFSLMKALQAGNMALLWPWHGSTRAVMLRRTALKTTMRQTWHGCESEFLYGSPEGAAAGVPAVAELPPAASAAAPEAEPASTLLPEEPAAAEPSFSFVARPLPSSSVEPAAETEPFSSARLSSTGLFGVVPSSEPLESSSMSLSRALCTSFASFCWLDDLWFSSPEADSADSDPEALPLLLLPRMLSRALLTSAASFLLRSFLSAENPPSLFSGSSSIIVSRSGFISRVSLSSSSSTTGATVTVFAATFSVCISRRSAS